MMDKSILIITREIVPYYYGGIGSQFKSMANLLVSEGFELTFITRKYNSYEESVFQKHYPGCSVYFVDESVLKNVTEFSYSGGLISHFNICYANAVEKELRKVYDKCRPQFIISADFGAEAFSCLLKKSSGLYSNSKFVLFIEGSTFDSLTTYEKGIPETVSSELSDPQNMLTCSMENSCVYLADYVISPTQITWEQTRKRLDCSFDSLIIPNIVGKNFYGDDIADLDRRKNKLILFVGRLDIHKGADLLLEAFIERYMDSAEKDIPALCFLGRDAFCKKYGKTFLEHWQERIPEHLEKYIEFKGQVLPETVREAMEKATLCAFPSRWEVYGIVCLEAMVCKCPVVVSSHTGLTEVIGPSFDEFKLDFEKNSSSLFELFERLMEKGRKEYTELCLAFHSRARKVVDEGNSALVDFFNTHDSRDTKLNGDNQPIFKELSNCFESLERVSSTLSYDFKALIEGSNVDKHALKEIIRSSEKSTDSDSFLAQSLTEKKQSLLKRLAGLFDK